ncbi:MAG: hypothetical protein PHW96_00210 [Candidatus Nanoarchaeia archaeon]|nr:hypothetical protein [Candidatus Nanoarchaeia archaeon]
MEDYKFIFNEAMREVSLADHIIYTTYPIVKDKALFLSAVNHLTNSAVKAINSYLSKEKYYKRILMVPESNRLKVRMFIEKYSSDMNINQDFWNSLLDMVELADSKPSRIQFEKQDTLCIVNENYRMFRFDMDKVKKHLILVKDLIRKIDNKL